MANAVYPKYKEQLLGTTGAARDATSLASGTVKAALVDTGTVAYNAAHDFYDDISTAVVGTPVTLTTKTVTNGIFDADDVTFTSVSGASCEAVVLYVDTAGANSTDPLVVFLDTNITGLPVTPNGGNITIAWNATGIFAL